MPGRVELIDWADQAHAGTSLDLDGLAQLKGPVEALEDLHVLAAGGGRPPGKSQVPNDTVDVFRGDVPGRSAQCGERPFQQSDVVLDGHRAEPTGPP
ncbi:hypothetical protein ABZ565_04290 [Streptomyces sp. NPDC016469]|uniref:hypothetical protein n=1 Tax=Streptomyces sp. NPDC016469 TaxID=3157191 RepID=UPI003400B48A